MPSAKLTNEDCKTIHKLLEKGVSPKDLARKYGVTRSTIYRRAKYPYDSKFVPLEVKNKIIRKIKEGYSKAEAAQRYGVPVNTVLGFTKGLPGHKAEGNHIIRKGGIELLRRLMTDGYLISGFVVSTVRNLQRQFPVIRSARYKDKTFFYLPGREEVAIEAFFREKPDRITNYSTIEELAHLLGLQVSNKDQRKLLERHKKKHSDYWRARHLIQRRLEDFYSEDELFSEQEWTESSFRLMTKSKFF
ncbi:Helix-turn-helix domain protein [Thermoplasmatales archaeon SCGC AB-539-N05]|nr:Helix-turn-helix domain protein [Thermoplasmatales archaeon SCGC AB-539-N05]